MLGNSVHAAQEAGVSGQHQNSSGTSTRDHLGDGYHSVVQQEYFLPHKDMYLRKGKWTAEEERYANKVIEYFNGGVLKLDDHERGITLRAYLAQKLGCDPMRITKKYTGASCLGKRVYHAFKQGGKSEEVDKATADLNALEDDFRSRLQQMNKRRGGTYTETMVSTPGIESMLNQAGYPAAGWNAQPGTMYGYPVPGYNAVDMHIKQQRRRQHQYHQNGGQSSAEASPYTSPLEQLSRTARSYSSDQTTAADNSPSLTGLRHNDPTDTRSDHIWGPPGRTTGGTSSANGGRASFSEHIARTSSARRTGSDDDSTSSGGSSTAQRRVKPHRDTNGKSTTPLDPLQRVKVSEHDTEAASSLLGFFTQLERNSSQEDMLHFFEGVQKTAAAATVAAVHSPPKSSVKKESVGGFNAGTGGEGKSSHVVDFPALPPPAYEPNKEEEGVDC